MLLLRLRVGEKGVCNQHPYHVVLYTVILKIWIISKVLKSNQVTKWHCNFDLNKFICRTRLRTIRLHLLINWHNYNKLTSVWRNNSEVFILMLSSTILNGGLYKILSISRVFHDFLHLAVKTHELCHSPICRKTVTHRNFSLRFIF